MSYLKKTSASNTFGTIKNANKHLVLAAIQKYKALTIEEIISHTNISRPTVLKILKELTKDTIIHKSGIASSDMGRQPGLFALNPNSYFAIGIDLDLPPIRINISDITGKTIYFHSWTLNRHTKLTGIIESLIAEIKMSIQKSKIPKESILGITLGIPGIINKNNNTVIRIDRIKPWDSISIKESIQNETNLPIFIRNDAHLLGTVEKSLLHKNIKNFLYIIHRSGIGMAIFIDNTIYEGNHGNAGYIGHTCVDIDGEKCECGKTGCLELFSSKRAIVKQYQQKINTQTKITFEDVINKSLEGDAIAINILTTASKYLGNSISNAIKLFDISHVILADSVNFEDNVFFQNFKTTIQDNLSEHAAAPIQVQLGKLSQKEYALGGCHFVLNKFFKAPQLKLHI